MLDFVKNLGVKDSNACKCFMNVMYISNMGYSIFIRIKKEEDHVKMCQFLETNMRHFNEEVFGETDNYYALRTSKETLSYSGNVEGHLLGFDYNACLLERHYVFELLKWISSKIGDKDGHYYYDGELSTFSEEAVSFPISLPEDHINKGLTFINLELKRLTELWNKECS